jgi:ArsR family transcriptional regulator
MEESQVVRALMALAHPMRLRVFRTLVGAGGCGLVPSVLSECLQTPAPSLSFHLKELMNSGLVTQERAGRNLVYRAALDHMNGVMGYLTAHCCRGYPCIASISPDEIDEVSKSTPAKFVA